MNWTPDTECNRVINVGNLREYFKTSDKLVSSVPFRIILNYADENDGNRLHRAVALDNTLIPLLLKVPDMVRLLRDLRRTASRKEMTEIAEILALAGQKL